MTNTVPIPNADKREAATAHAPEPTRNGWTYLPNVDIVELPDELLLMADMPGARPDDIDVHFERGTLTVQSRITGRQPRETRYLLREYGVGDFGRRFEIGDGIDPTGIRAELNNGVLTLHLPKTAAIKPRRIAVKGG